MARFELVLKCEKGRRGGHISTIKRWGRRGVFEMLGYFEVVGKEKERGERLDSLNDAGGLLLGLEKWEEGDGDVDEAGEVDVDLVVESGEIDSFGLGQIVDGLYAGI